MTVEAMVSAVVASGLPRSRGRQGQIKRIIPGTQYLIMQTLNPKLETLNKSKTQNSKFCVLPKFLKNYFWDTDFKEIDLSKDRAYILKRILNYGDQRAVGWMFGNFKKPEIKDALSNFRGYSQKSANYWVLVLGVPRKEVLCLRKRSSGEPRTFWPH